MPVSEYGYNPTSPAKITKALGDIFASMETEQQRYNRAANTNLLVAVSSADRLDAIESTIDAISVVHPSRFFVVYSDDTLHDIVTSISARCHGLSRSEHVCSEIVRIGTPRGKLWLVPSIVRGNLMVGTATELYIADGAVSRDLLDSLAPLADLIMFDSRDVSARQDFISEIARLSSNVLDLDWIELGPWREEIRTAFSKPIVVECRDDLSEVVITASGGRPGIPPFSALLLGGWVLHRLGLTRVMGRHGSIRAQSGGHDERSVGIRFESVGPGEPRIDAVTFRFARKDGWAGEVRVCRGNGLETIIECGRSMRSQRPWERETREGLIRRFFLIGESTANYNASLRGALHLARLE